MNPTLQLTFLGTGTSQGVPVIGCTCPVCTSSDPRDQRLRTSVLLRSGSESLIIDVGPDFRQQILRSKAQQLSQVLITHEHNDHVAGLDDLRPFIFKLKREMPIYALPRVNQQLRSRYDYAFQTTPYPGAPRFILQDIAADTALCWQHYEILPLAIDHGGLAILGFRIAGLGYLTDVHTIPAHTLSKLEGIDTLVISALHHTPHHSHINLEQALAYIERIQPRRAYLTHLSHRMGLHAVVSEQLPANVHIAYDQLSIPISEATIEKSP